MVIEAQTPYILTSYTCIVHHTHGVHCRCRRIASPMGTPMGEETKIVVLAPRGLALPAARRQPSVITITTSGLQ